MNSLEENADTVWQIGGGALVILFIRLYEREITPDEAFALLNELSTVEKR